MKLNYFLVLYLLCLNLIIVAQQQGTETPCTPINLVSNPNFTAGDTGFTSQIPVNGSCVANSYTITFNLNNKCSGWPNVSDHTQNGVFPPYIMAVDGNPTDSLTDIWRQTVNVCAGNTYTLSFWIYSVYTQSFTIGMNIDASKTNATINGAWNWIKHSRTWTAPSSGTVSIALIQNVGDHFCDFGIDDITFSSCPCITTGIDDTSDFKNSVNVYPNPSNHLLTVEMNGYEKAEIELYDIMGNKLKTYKQSGSILTLDLTGLTKGVYVLNIISNFQSASKKIILE